MIVIQKIVKGLALTLSLLKIELCFHQQMLSLLFLMMTVSIVDHKTSKFLKEVVAIYVGNINEIQHFDMLILKTFAHVMHGPCIHYNYYLCPSAPLLGNSKPWP